MPGKAARYRASLIDAVKEHDLLGAREACQRLYGAEAHEVLFEEDMQWSPHTFAPLVDAAIVAAVNGAPELCSEMMQNAECLHQKFRVEQSTVDLVKHVIERIDPEDSKDAAMNLINEQLEDTEIVAFLKIKKYL